MDCGETLMGLAFAAGEHPWPGRVRLAACLMVSYFVVGSHGN